MHKFLRWSANVPRQRNAQMGTTAVMRCMCLDMILHVNLLPSLNISVIQILASFWAQHIHSALPVHQHQLVWREGLLALWRSHIKRDACTLQPPKVQLDLAVGGLAQTPLSYHDPKCIHLSDVNETAHQDGS